MPKSLSHVPRYQARQPSLSAANENAQLDALKGLVSNIEVTAPLEATRTPGAIHIKVAPRHLGLLEGTKGELLQHDDIDWVVVPTPAAASIFFFNATTGLAQWIPAKGTCA